jgi:hypothetical protein
MARSTRACRIDRRYARHLKHLFAFLTLSAALLSLACRDSQRTASGTQIVLILDADPDVRELASTLTLDIARQSPSGESDGSKLSNTFPVSGSAAAHWPIDFALMPRDGDTSRTYQVRATLSDTTGPIAVLRAQTSFVPEQSIEVLLRFGSDCLYDASLACSELQTCAAGSCIDTPAGQGSSWMRELTQAMTAARPGLVPARAGAAAASGGPAAPPRSSAGAGGPSQAPTAGSCAASPAGPSSPAIPASMPSDAPNQANQANGGDCGDGHLDANEKCDTAIAQGEPGACPSGCADAAGCQVSQLEGSGCQSECVLYSITAFASDDGCCPQGGDASTDPDCSAVCGNGIVENDETCDPVATCPTRDSCAGSNACLRATIVGDAESCNAACAMQTIEQCVAGDGCCPSNCSSSTDNDCSPSCGDGVVDATAGELCEPRDSTHPCPTACDDGNACTQDFLTGAAANCNATCTSVPIVWALSGDGCCPAGANANMDADCQPLCGNRIVEPNERCDGRCPTLADCDDGIPCTRDEVAGTGCDRHCVHTAIASRTNNDGCCPAGASANNDNDCLPSCGNGEVERGETCDGNCVQASGCNDNVACTEDIVLGSDCQRVCGHRMLGSSGASRDGCCPDPSTMAAYMDADCPASCGNGNVEPGESCDGNCPACVDNDPCTLETITGTACNPTCMHQPVGAKNNDQCCPLGENPSTDNDCQAVCGNRVRETGETCDPCPTQCNDMDPCTRDMLTGSGCNIVCKHDPIGAGAMDGCCPPGTSSSDDRDCAPAAPVCGNGTKEAGENCDGADCPSCDDRNACTDDKSVPGSDACHPVCQHTPKSPNRMTQDGCCPQGADSNTDRDCAPSQAVCGNGTIENGETCDPCPTQCDDSNPCTSDQLQGTGCNARCTHEQLAAGPMDGCCPKGMGMADDPDCRGK